MSQLLLLLALEMTLEILAEAEDSLLLALLLLLSPAAGSQEVDLNSLVVEAPFSTTVSLFLAFLLALLGDLMIGCCCCSGGGLAAAAAVGVVSGSFIIGSKMRKKRKGKSCSSSS